MSRNQMTMKHVLFTLRNALLTCGVTLLAIPVNAATFPDYALLTQVKAIPPNILMVLDDSGSMEDEYMPDADPTRSGWATFSLRNYNINPLAYKPATTYKAWMNWNGARLTGGDTYDAVYSDTTLTKDVDDTVLSTVRDLRSTSRVVLFYFPTSGTDNPGDLNKSNYYEYSVTYTQSQVCDSRGRNCVWNWDAPKFWRRNASGGSYTDVTSLKSPVNREWTDELKNYATWYSYHRTRNKMAKAGAAEAFSGLGDNYRVGFDTIWNRDWVTDTSGSAGSTTGSTPAFPIPAGTGLFSGANKQAWFKQLFYSQAQDGTPLKGALQRAGRYYETAAPWKSLDAYGRETNLQCRQSFTILTTDGFWNDDAGWADDGDFHTADNVDNTNGTTYVDPKKPNSPPYGYTAAPPYKDSASGTLADVAMYYWKTDLQPNLSNEVPTGPQDPAFWQHMSTFSISIGTGGTLDPTKDLPALTNQSKNSNGTTGWPTPSANSIKTIDDLWHAAVNGHGQFTAATDPSKFAEALRKALGNIGGRTASGSNLASNGPYVTAGSYKYSAIYNSGQYWGDLRAFPRNLSSADYSTTATWKLSDRVNADPNFKTRPVWTWNGSAGASFTVLNASNATFGMRAGVSITENLNYIVGDTSNQSAKPDLYRDRQLSPIGDIVDSSPIFSNDSGYLFVGANDGMLHAIDSRTGNLSFSYVPAGIDMTALANLSDPAYTHKFFMDGQLYVSKKQNVGDKNYLVGALGRGGRGVFALDVTDPTRAGMTASKVLWDRSFQTGGDADMGYVLGAPSVKNDQGGSAVALVPNGIDSTNGKPVLFIYDMSTGLATKYTADDGTTTKDNGLMAIESADLDSDGKIDLVYGGDLHGNVWRWDLRTGSKVATRIFTATGPGTPGKVQAITGGISLAREGSTGRMFVAFGTGRMISTGDLPWNTDATDIGQHKETQSIYGLIDNLNNDATATIPGRSSLQQRNFAYYGLDSLNRKARSLESYSALPSDKRGWYIDLGVPANIADGERVVSAPVVVGRTLWIDSMWPLQSSDDCNQAAGDGYLNSLDVFTGTNPSNTGAASGTFSYIDVNGNGVGDDKLTTGVKKISDNSSATLDSSDGSGSITSVSHGASIGRPDVSTEDVCVQLDNGEIRCVKRTPGGGGAKPERLIWKELINHG